MANAEIIKDKYGNSLEISGFLKIERNFVSDNLKTIAPDGGLYQYDIRNAFTPVPRTVGAPCPTNLKVPCLTEGPSYTNLNIQQITVNVAHEFENALVTEARLTKRWRQGVFVNASGLTVQSNEDLFSPWFTRNDIDGQMYYEKLVGISRPDLGTIRYGTQLSRSWSRSDSFSYPIGLSQQWADSGAGFGVFPEAWRITSPQFEDANGKLTVELSYATNKKNTANGLIPQVVTLANGSTFNTGAVKPVLFELFLQYSNEKNLVELVYQTSRGAGQAAWGKNPVVGWIGDPDTVNSNSSPRGSGVPSQSMIEVQGNYFVNNENRLTYGIRRNQWSGTAATCAYNSNLLLADGTRGGCVFGVAPGFNYGDASVNYRGYEASSYDMMLGWSWYRGLYTYTLGGVYYSKASTDNPVEWGQSNQAVSVNLGVYRTVPELYKNLSVYGGMNFTYFDKLGPPPMSMPGLGFLGVNSHYDRSLTSLTMGVNLVF